MVQGLEFHSILENIFPDIKGLHVSDQLQVNCPMCQEREGLSEPDGKYNLEISTKNNKRVFKCWSCVDPPFSGSLGRLIRIFGTKIDYDIYKSYAGTFNDYEFDEDEKEYVPVKLPIEMELFSQLDEELSPEVFEAYNYLVNDRKINKDQMIKHRLGYCTYGRFAKRIIIPSYDSMGELNYFVGRSYDPKEKKRKYLNPDADKNNIIFGEGNIDFSSTVFLVEGVFDMFSVPNAIPLLGKTISTKLFMKLKEFKPNIIVLLDPDAYKNAIELFYMLHNIYVDCEEKVRIVKLPNIFDLDETRRNFGTDEVIKCLRTARQLTTDDYFISKLQKPYDNKFRNRRSDSNSKYFEWKSTV